MFRFMPAIPVQIVQYISDDQPGFVAAQLLDAFGKTHTFHDKVPVFGCALDLDRDSSLPVMGWLDCEIIEWFTENGRELALYPSTLSYMDRSAVQKRRSSKRSS